MITGQLEKGAIMSCQKVQSHVPDLYTGNLGRKLRQQIFEHLEICPECSKVANSWKGFCQYGKEVCLPPADLDWSSFNQALEAELHAHPIPKHHLFDWAAIWTYLTRELWNYPRRSALRWATAGTFAVIIVLGTMHLGYKSHTPALRSNLTIGEIISIEQENGLISYSDQNQTLTFHEEIEITLDDLPVRIDINN